MLNILFPVEVSYAIFALMLLQILFPVFSVLTGIYFLIIFLSAPGRSNAVPPRGQPVKRLLVLVPARNEENVISRALNSLRQVHYPPELLDVIVIADNCTDHTADVARQAGFQVLVRNNLQEQSKSCALAWALYDQGLLDRDYDALSVIDADCTVDCDFFLYIENELHGGAEIVQGHREALNPAASVFSSVMSIIHSFENRLWFLPHANHGLSTIMLGSGSAITISHLRRIGWNIRTLVEDAEFSIHSILAGARIRYCYNARYQVEIPTTLRLIWRQLRRWFSGQIACGRLYLAAIWRQVRHERNLQAAMMLITLIIPFNCTLGLFQLVLGIITTFEIVGGSLPWPALLFGLLVNQLAGMTAAVIILLLDGRLRLSRLREIWQGILVFPYWNLFLGVIYLVSYLHPKKIWVPMIHSGQP